MKLVFSLDKSEQFKLNLRVPAWSTDTTISLNGKTYDNVTVGKYFVIDRVWQSGDIIEIEIDMSVHYWVGEQECAGKESVFYGSVLLAMKWPKTLEGECPADIVLQRDDVNALILSDDLDCLLCATVKAKVLANELSQQKDVHLIAYADAWTEGQIYETWLRIANSN